PPEDVRGVERAGESRSGVGREPWRSRLGNAGGPPGRGCDHPTHGPVPAEPDPDFLRAAPADFSPDRFEPCRKGSVLTSSSRKEASILKGVSPNCALCLSVPCLDIYGCYW